MLPNFDEFMKLSSFGMAWENHIGPHIARGGSAEELEGLMDTHAIPEGLKNRFRKAHAAKVQGPQSSYVPPKPGAAPPVAGGSMVPHGTKFPPSAGSPGGMGGAGGLGGIGGKIRAAVGKVPRSALIGGAAGATAAGLGAAYMMGKRRDAQAQVKVARDLIPGGLADSGPPKNVDQAQVRKGIKSELEHTNRRDIAREIAFDHLTEDPKYYTKLDKMEKSSSAVFDELNKLGAISEDQARASLERLDSLEKAKPTAGQVARYGAIGAAAAPGIKVLTNAIHGKSLHDFGQAGKGLRGIARGAAGSAVGGALMAGAVPLVRSHFDRKAESGTLKKYVAQYDRQNQAAEQTPHPEAPKTASIHKLFPRASSVVRRSSWDLDKQTLNIAMDKKDDAADKLKKVAFQQSGYGATGGYVDFHQISAQAPFRRPSLQTAVDQKVDALYGVKTSGVLDELVREMAQEDTKEAGAMTPVGLSPASRLASAQRIAKPKITAPSGPSIGDIAKPMGFGRKIPGATKTM